MFKKVSSVFIETGPSHIVRLKIIRKESFLYLFRGPETLQIGIHRWK